MNVKEETRERLNLTKDILLAIALAGGVVMLLAIAPGLGVLLKPIIKAKKYSRRSIESTQIKRRLQELRRSGLIAISEQGGRTRLYLTRVGKRKVLEYRVDDMQIERQDPWDGRYRFVMFDIPERKRLARDVFRQKLVELGFEKIQQSIWRHKYPCTKEIEFLIHLYGVGKCVDVVEGKRVL